MKKLISLLAVFAIVLSLCACGGNVTDTTGETNETSAATEASTEATEPALAIPDVNDMTPEQKYGHINQLEPVDGVYKIWNEVGVQNMVNHPDAKFQLLCNVDMKGATVSPIGTADKPFTGEIDGANFSISNFTLQGGDEESFGFVTVNKGEIHNFLIENVTFVPGEKAKQIGTLAGINEGKINRCTTGGTLNVTDAAEDALCGSLVGSSTGILSNTVVNVELNYTAPGEATVAGIAGQAEGTIEFVETNGKLEITGQNKTAALFVGHAKNLQINLLAFVGAANSQDGILFENYFGTKEAVSGSRLLVRENGREPERPAVQEKRQKAVDYMNELVTIEYKLQDDLYRMSTSCTCCGSVLSCGNTYYGPTYGHKLTSLYRMQYCIGEDGYLKDFVHEAGAPDGFDMYISHDCSAAVRSAYETVSTKVSYTMTHDILPFYNTGMALVGPYVEVPDLLVNTANNTKTIIDYNGEEVIYESYAQVRMGDSVVCRPLNSHNRMCVSDAVVVRDENGKIDPNYSYILMSEQGGGPGLDAENKIYTSCTKEKKYTFASLLTATYIPVTIEEFVTGEFEEIDCKLEGGVSNSRFGLTTGKITSNYSIDSVTMVITNDAGEEVYNHRIFTTVSKQALDGNTAAYARAVRKEYNLANFASPLQQDVVFEKGVTYHATITANLMTGDAIVVNDFSFTNG